MSKQITATRDNKHNQPVSTERTATDGGKGIALAPPTYGLALADVQQRELTPPLPIIQAKLTIGAPDDPYERAADQMAAQVVQCLQTPTRSLPARFQIFQQPADLEAEGIQLQPLRQPPSNMNATVAPWAVEGAIQQLRGRGQPLPTQVRQPLESVFGADFSEVRVHTDDQADHLNRTIQAKAFTTGQDVFFQRGAYQPESRGGQALLAHELTHVIQQNSDVPQPHNTAREKTRFILKSTPTPGVPSIQRKLARYTQWADIIPTIGAHPIATQVIGDTKVQKFLDNVINDPNDWAAVKIANPTERVNLDAIPKPKGGYTKTYETAEHMAKWIVRLYNHFNEVQDSDTGYAPDDSSLVATKTAHAANWLTYVKGPLNNMLLNLGVNKAVAPYKTLFKNAKTAARSLDQQNPGVDPTPAVNTVKAFADYVHQNKLVGHTVKPIVPTWRTEGRYGTGLRVRAIYEPGFTMPKGSGASIKTPIDWFYEGRTADGVNAYYIKGHLLNDHVGGLARNYNLAPLTATRNKEHEGGIEHDLKAAVRLMTTARLAGKPAPYQRIEYTTELGPQTGPRDITLIWQAAKAYWDQHKALNPNFKKLTLQDILNDATAPEAAKQVIRTWNLVYNKTPMAQVYPWVHTAALLLETEDYLVRDWLIHLNLILADGREQAKFISLHNEKLNDLKVLIKQPLTTQPTLGHNVTDTQAVTPSRPTALKRVMTDLNEPYKQGFLQWLGTQPENQFPVLQDAFIENDPQAVMNLLTRYEAHLEEQKMLHHKQQIMLRVSQEQNPAIIEELYGRISKFNDFPPTQAASIQEKQMSIFNYLLAKKNRADIEAVNKEYNATQMYIILRAQQQQLNNLPNLPLVPMNISNQLVTNVHPWETSQLQTPHTFSFGQFNRESYPFNQGQAQVKTPAEMILDTFKDLLQSPFGQHILDLALSHLERLIDPQQRQQAYMLWGMFMGETRQALHSETPDETILSGILSRAMQLFAFGGAGTTSPAVVDANLLRYRPDLQKAVMRASERYQTSPQKIIEALNHPEPNIRLDMLHRLEWWAKDE